MKKIYLNTINIKMNTQNEKHCDINYITSRKHKFYNRNGCNYIMNNDHIYYLSIPTKNLISPLFLETKIPSLMLYSNMQFSKGIGLYQPNKTNDFIEINALEMVKSVVIDEYLFVNNKQVYEVSSYFNEKIILSYFNKIKTTSFGLMTVFEQARIHDRKTGKMVYNNFMSVNNSTNEIVMESFTLCKYTSKILKKRKLITSTNNINKIIDFHKLIVKEQNSF